MTKTELFNKYGTNTYTFIETGTHRGDGIQAALKCGFSRIISFEISGHLAVASRRFARELSSGKVRLFNKSSTGEKFKQTVIMQTDPALIWLDAYFLTRKNRDTMLNAELIPVSNSKTAHTVLISRGNLLSETPEEYLRRLNRRPLEQYQFAGKEKLPDDNVIWCFAPKV